MQRRRFLHALSLPAAAPWLSACGGGDSDGTEPGAQRPATDEEIVLEPGVDPDSLRSLPGGLAPSREVLLAMTEQPLSATVWLGLQPQTGVTVQFWDAAGALRGEGVTDANGQCQLSLPAPFWVRAKAHTPQGVLQGIAQGGGRVQINLVQDLQARVQDLLPEESFASAAYVVAKYFNRSVSQALTHLGPNEPGLSQERMRLGWQASGQTLEAFLAQLAQAALAHVKDEGPHNLSYAQAVGRMAAPPAEDLGGEGMAEAEAFVQTVLADAAAQPLDSALYTYMWSRFFQPKQDAEVPLFEGLSVRFEQMMARINSLASHYLTTGNALESELEKHLYLLNWKPYFFGYVTSILKDASLYGDAKAAERLIYAYRMGMEAENSAFIYARNVPRYFFGCYDDDGAHFLPSAKRTLEKFQFFTMETGILYRSLLSAFAAHNVWLLGHMAGAELAIAAHKGETNAALQARMQYYHDLAQKILALTRSIDVQLLPERVFIDVKQRKAWVGACKDVVDWHHFIPPSVTVNVFDPSPNIPTEVFKGPGMPSERYMRSAQNGDHGVDAATYAWAEKGWRMPKPQEMKDSFYRAVNDKKMRIDTMAYASMVPVSVPFTRAGTSRLVTVVTDSAEQYLVFSSKVNPGGKMQVYQFESHAIKVVNVGYRYRDDKHIYAYFPVTDVTDAQLERHVPWQRWYALLQRTATEAWNESC